MPGFSESVADIEGVRQELAKHYRVIAAELPGSGRSTPIPRAYTKRFYEDDAASMAAILEDRAIRSARLAGFSDGGEVALLLAARRPDLVRTVVSWGAVGVIPPGVGPSLDALARLIDDPPPRMAGWSADLVARYGREAARETMKSWSAAIRDLLLDGGDISLLSAHKIRCPALLIVGERDTNNPAEALRALAQRIPSAEVIVVEGAGHPVHRDRPDWFIPTIVNWLAAH